MVENKNVNINLIYNFVMAGFSCVQGVPLHRCLHQLGAYTNPKKCIAYHRTLYPTDKLFPARIIPGIKSTQARLYPGILWPGTTYNPGYIMA